MKVKIVYVKTCREYSFKCSTIWSELIFASLFAVLSTHLTLMKNVQQFPLFDLLIVYTPQFPPLERKKKKNESPGHIKSDKKNNEESVILWKISGHVETCYWRCDNEDPPHFVYK